MSEQPEVRLLPGIPPIFSIPLQCFILSEETKDTLLTATSLVGILAPGYYLRECVCQINIMEWVFANMVKENDS